MGVAIVTGANRGLGLGVSEDLAKKGHTVIMAGRKLSELLKHQAEFKQKDLKVHVLELDVSSPASIEAGVKKVIADFKSIDILVNNAGVFKDGLKEDVAQLSETMTDTLRTNTIGPALMIQAALPHMKVQNRGRIVNVSSGMGGLNEMDGGYFAYRVSKAALNAITKVFAAEIRGQNILINSVCPGWVKTDMGGAGADREVAEGVASIVWAALLPDGGPSGGFYRDGKALQW